MNMYLSFKDRWHKPKNGCMPFGWYIFPFTWTDFNCKFFHLTRRAGFDNRLFRLHTVDTPILILIFMFEMGSILNFTYNHLYPFDHVHTSSYCISNSNFYSKFLKYLFSIYNSWFNTLRFIYLLALQLI
jgi:hypothetical protein